MSRLAININEHLDCSQITDFNDFIKTIMYCGNDNLEIHSGFILPHELVVILKGIHCTDKNKRLTIVYKGE